ncbi:hypothetical protein GCM10010837_45490 [Aminobacter niigataensis]
MAWMAVAVFLLAWMADRTVPRSALAPVLAVVEVSTERASVLAAPPAKAGVARAVDASRTAMASECLIFYLFEFHPFAPG